jgi:hypothetical protein
MRKRIIDQPGAGLPSHPEERWLDLERLAEVEVSSEAPNFPIESALVASGGVTGWRAAQPGEQLIRIIFDAPAALRRIQLHFVELVTARTQEFVLRWAHARGAPPKEIVRQQWTFSPQGSTSEVEDYRVNLTGVGLIELSVKPDLASSNAVASLAAWRIA